MTTQSTTDPADVKLGFSVPPAVAKQFRDAAAGRGLNQGEYLERLV